MKARLEAHATLPDGLVLDDELGKGSNNRVFSCAYQGKRLVLRVPRRRSDTQKRGSALWELWHTERAAALEVAPMLHDAWIARHAHGQLPSGLYLITEAYSHDLDDLLCHPRCAPLRDDPDSALWMHKDTVADQVVAALDRLAQDHLFVYDLKPSNVVLRFRDARVDARIIDFGRDFCEWGKAPTVLSDDVQTPVLDVLRRHVDDDALVAHVLGVCMLVQLSAITTRSLYQDRARHRMPRERRAALQVFAPRVRRLLDTLQGRTLGLVRRVLRMDSVRDVFRHYLGRRDAGTRRILRFATGCE